jgi:hypothetical protein
MSLNKFTIPKSFAILAGVGSGKTYTMSRGYANALLDFDNSDEKACEWSDYRFRHKSVLMENIEVEEKA